MGGYALLAKIGEGGMGVVHLARRGEGQRVALKVLRPHIVGDDEARRRLAREVGSLSRIKSRWVAEIVDADPWAPVPYVATRYVPGLSLHDYVHEEGPISGKDLTWFAACLAEGVASVHAVGVLHRDVKPSNVLMEGRTPILIDFGLARVADDPKLTHTGWLLGTPGYLAPEILYGDDATAASDVHSWAATVAFAATGARRSGAVRRWRSWTGSGVGSTTSPASRTRCASCSPTASSPSRRAVRPSTRSSGGCGRRWRRRRDRSGHAPPAPDRMTMPYAVAHRLDPDRHRLHRRAARRDPGVRRHPGAHRAPDRRRARDRAAAAAAASGDRRPGPPAAGRADPPRVPCSSVGALLCGGIVAAPTLVRLGRAAAGGLAAAQRLAGRERGRRPAPAARPQVVRRRAAAASAPRGSCSARSRAP